MPIGRNSGQICGDETHNRTRDDRPHSALIWLAGAPWYKCYKEASLQWSNGQDIVAKLSVTRFGSSFPERWSGCEEQLVIKVEMGSLDKEVH